MELGRVGMAPTAGIAAGHMTLDDTALEDPADLDELPGEPTVVLCQGVELLLGGTGHRSGSDYTCFLSYQQLCC